MSLGEFDLIRTFFQNKGSSRSDTRLGVGDDCALLRPRPGMELAVTVDTLVSGVHFLADTDPVGLGHKALAVNLSDLAAMGAEPAWLTLALTLPETDESWLRGFSRGFLDLAERYGAELVGGDTTRGPLSISVQAMGFIPEQGGLRRSTAQPGDGIYVTGELGLAGLGLHGLLGKAQVDDESAMARLLRPEPRVQAGLVLREFASACIDISDGLAGDLGHILAQSLVGATLDWDALPLPDSVRAYVARSGDWHLPLSAGEDYELCFTVAEDREADLMGGLGAMGCAVTRIGTIDKAVGLRMRRDGQTIALAPSGFQHFRS